MNTTSPKSRYAKFLDQFAIGVENERGHMEYVRWHGNVGYVALNACVVARVELSDRGYQGHFDKLEVQIIHRASGKLDVLTFEFNDYLTQADRVDGRNDQPDQRFHAWASSGKSTLDWYIAKPKTAKPVSNAINEYLMFWQGSRF